MPINLNPISTISSITLPITGTLSDVAAAISYSIYTSDQYFISGAVDQVKFVYHRLGGSVLDVEITAADVYVAYDEAVREYSSLINNHQAANVLLSALGYTTGTFDNNGEILTGTDVSLKYPRFDFGYAKNIATAYSQETNVGGDSTLYSASVTIIPYQQTYDLQEIVSNSVEFSASVGTKKILVKQVYYKSPAGMWRFFGFYGGYSNLGGGGGGGTYGQYSDDSTFYLVPVWQSKLQAIQYEDALWTRTSHYSFEVVNNWLKVFPIPSSVTPKKMWIKFMIPTNPWEEANPNVESGIQGINNINTLPFANIPYQNINSMGKQWIRQYALAICKEVLGQVRGKLDSIPLPKGSVKLNSSELLSQAKEEKETLRKELLEKLDKLSYYELNKRAKEMANDTMEMQKGRPLGIYVG